MSQEHIVDLFVKRAFFSLIFKKNIKKFKKVRFL